MKITAFYTHRNPFVAADVKTTKRITDISEFLKQDRLCELAKDAAPDGYYLSKIEHPEYTVLFNEQGEKVEE